MAAGSSRQPRVEHRGRLTPPDGFDRLAAAGVGLEGLVALWVAADDEKRLAERYEGSGGATFPRTVPTRAPAVALATHRAFERPSDVVVVPELPVSHPLVQRLPDGAYLVVGGRCAWRVEGPEQNALVVTADGRVRRRGCLGDGLSHLQVDAAGDIWTGFFDEGVFGNLGWGGPGPRPLGAGGIARWSPDLEKTWELDPEEGLVADCYALNVADDGVVWACPYTDFPVLRVSGGEVLVHPTTGIQGPHGIVVHGERVALLGAYRDPHVLVAGDLIKGRFEERTRAYLWSADGAPLRAGSILCRGSVVYALAGRDVLTYDLADHP